MTNDAGARMVDAESHRPVARAWWRAADRQDMRSALSDDDGIDPAEGLLDRPLFDSFAAVARRQPDSVAVAAGGSTLSYGALLARATALAERLAAATAPGAAVATLLADPADSAAAMLACMAAGRPCISLNAHHPPARLAEILADAAPAALVLSGGTSPCALPEGLATISLHGPATLPSGRAPRLAPGAPDSACIIIFTSGSTGRPKGIVRSQQQMLVRAQHRVQQFGLRPADRMLLLYPLSTGPGVSACLGTLLAGAALHVADVSVLGARGVLDIALTHRITTVTSVPVLLRMLFAMPGAGASFAALHSVYTSSESVLRQDVDRWRTVLPTGCVVRTGYGLTEGAPLADWFVTARVPGEGVRMPIGYPLPWHEFAITDPAGEPVAAGEAGELWVRGRLLSMGEWRQGRCVPGRLLSDPDDPEGAVLRTGDLVRLREDGLLEFLGRIDDQIRIRCNRVEPAELELVLRETPGVAEAAILARRTAGDPVLVAFAVPAGRAHAAADPGLHDAAMRRLGAALPSYMLPARLHLVPALPRLPTGKIDPAGLARLDDAARDGGV